MPAVFAIIAVVAILACMGAAAFFARRAFGPLDSRQAVGGRARFQIVDLLALCVWWQFALAPAWMFPTDYPSDPSLYILSGSLLLGVSAIWYSLVARLSNLQINHSGRRAVILCIAAPVGILATVTVFAALMSLLLSLAPDDWAAAFAALVVLAACLPAGALCRWLINWAVRPPSSAPESAGLLKMETGGGTGPATAIDSGTGPL